MLPCKEHPRYNYSHEQMIENSFLQIFVFSLLLGFGGAVSPGPVSTAIVSQAPRQGARVGPLVALGHSILELLMVAMIAFGLQRALSQSNVQIAVSLAGGVLLLFMGAKMLIDLRKGGMQLPQADDVSEQSKASQLVWLGMATTLANPFWFAWWISVPSSYLAQVGALGLLPLAAFYLGHISADFAWDSTLAVFVGGGSRWMSDKVYGLIIAVSGAFLLYLGVSFFLEGLRLLEFA